MATPDRIVDIAIGYMGAKQLFAAARIGLFPALAGGPRTAAEIAAETGVPPRIARILADAMNARGLLDRAGGRYRLADDAAEYLSGRGVTDLAPFLTFLDEISYGHWLQFGTTVDTGEPGDLRMDDARWATFMGGVMRYNALHAAMLARAVDFTPFESMLDFGGLSPEFALGALRANPGLSVRFVFAPGFTQAVTDATAAFADRVRVEPAETETAKPGGGHDLVLLGHVVHRFTAEQNRDIVASARAAARDGAKLLLLDFFLDDDERQRPIDALHAGEYLVIDGTVVYPEADVRSWLADAGWRVDDVLALPGSPRVLVAEAV